jgi:hypothetical protein
MLDACWIHVGYRLDTCWIQVGYKLDTVWMHGAGRVRGSGRILATLCIYIYIYKFDDYCFIL